MSHRSYFEPSCHRRARGLPKNGSRGPAKTEATSQLRKGSARPIFLFYSSTLPRRSCSSFALGQHQSLTAGHVRASLSFPSRPADTVFYPAETMATTTSTQSNLSWTLPTTCWADPDWIRTKFSSALSEMYKAEVPLYADLLQLVRDVNEQTMQRDPALRASLMQRSELGLC